MIKQDEIKLWCNLATAVFINYMPEVDKTPEIHIVTDKILKKRRSEIAERLKAPQRDIDFTSYEAVMELVHGENGDAIIIRQLALNELLKHNDNAFHGFCIMFWHEMGHFYAITKEKTDLHRFMNADFDDDESNIKQEGYWFWSEYIAQCIAHHVEFLHCSIDNKDNYHPENIQWTPEIQMFISDKLTGYLDLAFDDFAFYFDSSAIAMYFALIFKDDLTVRYLKAMEEGKPFSEEDLLELLMIDETDLEYHDTLLEIYAILSKQMQKERFWEIDEQWLFDIGNPIIELSSHKLFGDFNFSDEMEDNDEF